MPEKTGLSVEGGVQDMSHKFPEGKKIGMGGKLSYANGTTRLVRSASRSKGFG